MKIRFISFAVLMMLTFAPASLQAQSSALTADQRNTLTMLLANVGHTIALDSVVTAALGLSKGGEILTLRQLTVNGHPNLHTYIPLPDGGVLLSVLDTKGAWACRLDADLKLITAVFKLPDHAPVVIPVSDAERNVQAELAYWAAVAGRHPNGK